jgi:hypothetical protein
LRGAAPILEQRQVEFQPAVDGNLSAGRTRWARCEGGSLERPRPAADARAGAPPRCRAAPSRAARRARTPSPARSTSASGAHEERGRVRDERSPSQRHCGRRDGVRYRKHEGAMRYLTQFVGGRPLTGAVAAPVSARAASRPITWRRDVATTGGGSRSRLGWSERAGAAAGSARLEAKRSFPRVTANANRARFHCATGQAGIVGESDLDPRERTRVGVLRAPDARCALPARLPRPPASRDIR